MTFLVQSGLVFMGSLRANPGHLSQKAFRKNTHLLSLHLISPICLQNEVFDLSAVFRVCDYVAQEQVLPPVCPVLHPVLTSHHPCFVLHPAESAFSRRVEGKVQNNFEETNSNSQNSSGKCGHPFLPLPCSSPSQIQLCSVNVDVLGVPCLSSLAARPPGIVPYSPSSPAFWLSSPVKQVMWESCCQGPGT